MNYYEILGISNDASQAEIKQAYRRLTLKTHPDKNINGNDNEFKKLTEAFETLFDIDKRIHYDAFNNKNNKKYNDFSKKINQSLVKVGNYGNLFAHTNENNPEKYPNNLNENLILSNKINENNENKKILSYIEPIRKNIEITIEESFNGCSCPLNIERKIGNIIENELIYINIPPGTDKGEVIELKEKGNIDKYGNIGDVRITIDIKSNNKYTRNKLDLIMNVEITLLQSLCGFSLEIDHLDGKTYRINSNEGNVVASGTKRIIQKKGFTRGEATGNLIILFNVIFPEKIKIESIKKLRELFENI